MIRNIIHDPLFLQQKSSPATLMDAGVAADLKDTLAAYSDRCVGMAANMIGVCKNIIIVNTGMMNLIMYNPKILKKSGPYQAMEGCLSLTGERRAKRYEKIEVEYQDESFKKVRHTFTGFTAQIIQHEIDHCQGILI